MSKPKVAIIYYSATGTTHQLAEEIQSGAREAGTPYGTSFVSENGALDPDENTRQAARFQGARVVRVTQRLRAGERELTPA